MESNEDDDVIPDGFEEAIRDEGGWVDINSIDTPPLTLKEIHKFFVQQRLQKEQVTASKPFEREYRLLREQDARNITASSIYMYLSHPMICVALELTQTICPTQ